MRRLGPAEWEVPIGLRPDMHVPVRVFASESVVHAFDAKVFEQAANVATLPGIVGANSPRRLNDEAN